MLFCVACLVVGFLHHELDKEHSSSIKSTRYPVRGSFFSSSSSSSLAIFDLRLYFALSFLPCDRWLCLATIVLCVQVSHAISPPSWAKTCPTSSETDLLSFTLVYVYIVTRCGSLMVYLFNLPF